MKKIKLGKSKTEVLIMNAEEVTKFLSDKTIYHHSVFWLEKWKHSIKDILRYFPHGGFTLPSSVKLQRYDRPGYSADCLGHRTTTGKAYWTYNRYKITIRESKNGNMYYVTKIKK
jgi:hypothetical protein